MARYQLPEYRSVYKDPQSVAINAELRDRFSKSFLADDELSAAVDAMNSADFEGDKNLKNELATEYNNRLDERARRGDYETMGMSITRDARGFIKGYSPIKQNYDAVQAYKAEQKKKYDDGKIYAETYQHSMGLSSQDYHGLQKNDDGTIDEDSYFSGYSTVEDIDISAEFDERMKGYVSRKGGESIQLVEQGDGGKYQIMKGGRWEDVPQADIDDIMNDMLANPNIQASLRQKADIRTYQLTDTRISTSISNSLYGDPENEEDTGLIGEYQKLVNSGKTDKKTIALMEQYEKIIEERQGLLGETGTETPEELIANRKNFTKQQVIDQEIGREKAAAYAKYVRHNVWTEYAEDYDKRWLIDYKVDKENYIADMQINREMTQVANAGGDNLADINKYITSQNNLLDGVSVTATEDAIEAGLIQKGEIITLEMIMSGEGLPEGMSDEVKQSYKRHATTIQKQIAIQQELKKQALQNLPGGGIVAINSKLDAINIKNPAGKWETTGAEFLLKAQEILGDETLTYGDLNILRDVFKKVHGVQEFKLTDISTWLKEHPARNFGLSHPLYDQYQKVSKLLGGLVTNHDNATNTVASYAMFATMTQAIEKNYEQINKDVDNYLKKNSTREVGGKASTVISGADTKTAQANTKVVRDAFIKKPLPKDFEIYYNGQIQKGTGNVASLIEDLGWEGTDVMVTDVMFDTTSFMGEPTLALTVKGKKDGEVAYETITVPYSNLKQTGLDQYFNTPDYRQAQEVNEARLSGLDGTIIKYDNGVTLQYDFKTGGKSSQDLITYTDSSGKKQTITPTETILINGQNVNLLSYIITEADNAGINYTTKFD